MAGELQRISQTKERFAVQPPEDFPVHRMSVGIVQGIARNFFFGPRMKNDNRVSLIIHGK